MFKTTFPGFIILFFALRVNSQGCSDAGLCSTGLMMSGTPAFLQDDTIRYPEIFTGIGLNYGLGEKFISVFRLESETQFKLSSKSSIDLKIPYLIASGELGTVSGPGDVGLSFSTILGTIGKKKSIFSLTTGIRIPANNSDLRNNDGLPVPMAYQSSLGTWDLIVGLRANLGKNYALSAGYQHPLYHNNKNSFDPLNFPETNAGKFKSVPDFRRSSDAMLRFQRDYSAGRHYAFASLLVIYHLNEDSFVKPVNGNRENFDESSGFTVNLANHIDFRLSDKWNMKVTAGFPVYARHVRPDGLTRTIAAGITLLSKI